MRLNPPKKVVWSITLILGILGVVLQFLPNSTLPSLPLISFLLVAVAWLLLILSTVLKGL
jgi:predicted membrane channel-forming protein YqfA (hemolysin III family)